MPDDSPAPLDVAVLRALLGDTPLGSPLVYLPAIPSTNTHASELARAGAAEGTLVTTDDQTAGRGRVGRVWKAMPRQQLAMSLILRPAFPPHFLVMASALAVADAIAALTGARPAIKWPNDVLLNGRKVCGILIETSEGVAILGMGVNVGGALDDDPELAARATTLAVATGQMVSREALAAEIIRRLGARYAALQSGGAMARSALRAEWRGRLATLGGRATIRQREATLVGVAEDVDEDGALLLRLDDGRLLTIHWGDVE